MSPRQPAVLRGDGEISIRDHLIACAARLIAERAAANLTVREIAHAAKVADGVLYNHFEDKEELLALALQMHVHGVMSAIDMLPQPGEGTLKDNLCIHISQGLQTLSRILPVFATLMSEPAVITRFHQLLGGMADERMLPAMLVDYLREEQRIGRVDPDADTAAAATMLIGACHELVLPRLLLGHASSEFEAPAGFVEGIVSTALQGIAHVTPTSKDRRE